MAGPAISSADDLAGLLALARRRAAARGDRLLGRAVRHRHRPRARRGRRGRRPVLRRLARLAHRRAARAVRRPAGHRRHRCASTTADARRARRARAPRPGCRPGSTPSATPRSTRCSTRSTWRPSGSGAPVGAGHRIEHAEYVRDPARLAASGLIASMQPMFDAAWGGPDGMYAARLGAERAARAEPRSPSWPPPACRWPSARTRRSPRSARGPPSGRRATRTSPAAALDVRDARSPRTPAAAGRPPGAIGRRARRRRARHLRGLDAATALDADDRAARPGAAGATCRRCLATVRDGDRRSSTPGRARVTGTEKPARRGRCRSAILDGCRCSGRSRCATPPPPFGSRWAALGRAGRRRRRGVLAFPRLGHLAARVRQRRRAVVWRSTGAAARTGAWLGLLLRPRRSSSRCCTGPASTSARRRG